jgi:hypothetical protein
VVEGMSSSMVTDAVTLHKEAKHQGSKYIHSITEGKKKLIIRQSVQDKINLLPV